MPLISPFALLKDALTVYKNRFGTLFVVYLIPNLASIFTGLIIGFTGVGLLAFARNNFFEGNFVVKAISVTVAFFLLLLVSFVIQTWGHVALITAVVNSEEKIGIRESYKRAWSQIFSYWWLTIITSFVILGGFMLLFFPGIIFSIWFSMAYFVLVVEKKGGIDALLKSREYVKGYWWGVFGRLAFLPVFFIIVYFVPTLIFQILKLKIIETIFASLVIFILAPLGLIYLWILFKNLKLAKGEFEFIPSNNSRLKFVLVAILGGLILPLGVGATIVLVSINPSKQLARSRDQSRKSSIYITRTAIELYYAKSGVYPESLGVLVPEYMSQVPKDPKTEIPLRYTLTNEVYEICADYEVEEDECISSSRFSD
ncbi:hypothetical protein A2955_04600 [Candidatus Woesebacteria bacterium RIFCSPLOWO2_01_FULL_37_19]|uniref:Glycerophosphoryl diester phosphodiesterase membrane domain-containing protein n=2 Tax=Candidatus Woeseibacteriota TaxID=1752722 RepID=A0A1F8BCI9_9BACT|nr:MAG: hypothetical protein A2771_01560 [Candidatus Woesebacteria bacterium RIFCSPHIGHO2_01_FULL_38_26b]OGM61075.1 MAG: hypothetical protein A2955_04600 [Candidatus Woesebacteria bacterium RIFCSPLOWO2_01_FULL_37_19]